MTAPGDVHPAAAAATTWEAVKFFASATALMTALLYYFGWISTRARYEYFGIETGLLGFSAPDYLLRSANAAIPPAALVALIVLVLAGFDPRRWPGHAVSAKTHRRLLLAMVEVRVIAVQLLALVAVGLVAQEQIGAPLGILLPVSLSLACGILFYTDESTTARRALLATLAVLGLLWTIALYAPEVGHKAARNAVAGLSRSPDVVLYSKDRMSIAGLGIEVTELPQKESAFSFRYAGLRLLIYTHERYFLLPATWRKGRDSVYVVRDSDDVRVDLHPAGE